MKHIKKLKKKLNSTHELSDHIQHKETKTHNAVQTALSNFDALPSCGFVRISVVMALFGISASTVWRLVAANTIKTYKHTPRTTSFNVGELRALLATKAVK